MTALLRSIVVLILTWEARLLLARHSPRIIAVTGSVGKTTTKDAIYAALSRNIHVRKSSKSFNSELGVPLTILGLESGWNDPLKWLLNIVHGAFAICSRSYPDWLVLEVGADRPGDIHRIARWLRPDISIITGVPDIPVHVEYFNSPGEVMKEKRGLADNLKPGGTLVLNGDDLRMRMIQSSFRGACITYGYDASNTYAIIADELLYTAQGIPDGSDFTIMRKGNSLSASVHGALGKPRVYAATAAIAVAEAVGVSPDDATMGIAAWEPPPGRMRVLPGIHGSILIDDTYNSSPAAALAALDALQALPGERHIAMLGDMLELGRYSAEAHKQVGARAAKSAQKLITVGFRARGIAESALDSGLTDDAILQYEMNEAERAAHELKTDIQKGDIVLIKGSQGMRMEKAVRVLMAEPEKAGELLVRMDPEWINR
jgi:UDP-N-acetylmuramyl pentapeptide synthase